MPNFCAIDIQPTHEYIRVSSQTARINDTEDGYDYSSITTFEPKRKMKFVFVQNNQDTDIMTLKVVKKATNEALMDWKTNSTGQNVGFETFTEADNGFYGGNQINTLTSLSTALLELTTGLNILGRLI